MGLASRRTTGTGDVDGPRRRRRRGGARRRLGPAGSARPPVGAQRDARHRQPARRGHAAARAAAGALTRRSLSRGWAIVGALSVTEIVSWGVLYYAFAVFLVPMQRELGASAGGADRRVLARAAGGGRSAGIGMGRASTATGRAALMTAGSVAGVPIVVAWSRVEGLAAYYAIWVALRARHGRPSSTSRLSPCWRSGYRGGGRAPAGADRADAGGGASSSFIFLPLAQALIDAHGWRDALLDPGGDPRRR